MRNCLQDVANAKDINAVLGYMEQTGKVPEVEPIAPPEIAARDTAELLDPGDYFNPEVRTFRGYSLLFTSSRTGRQQQSTDQCSKQ